MRRHRFFSGVMAAVAVVVVGFFLQSRVALSESPAKGNGSRPEDRAAIRQTMNSFIAAFQKGDATAAADLMTAEAEVIPDEGEPLKGREAIQKAYVAHFAKNPKTKIKLEMDSLRFTSRDTAIEDGHMKVTPEKGESETHRYHVLYVREDGKWLLSVIKEWPSETASLQELDWLIGRWAAKRDDLEVNSTYEWFGDKSFIKATFSIKGKEKSFSGMQIIGIEPKTGELRSWTFEHDGAFGEATVTRDGKKWIFDSATSLTNGSVLTASNIMIQVNGDTFTWQPANLAVDGEQVRAPAPIKVTRIKGKN